MLTLNVTEKGGTPKRIEFDKDEVTVGRVPGNDIVLPKGNVSKRHARIVLKDGKFIIVDLKSTILQFVHAYFGEQTKARFRPSFFPFTEPSGEVDVWFDFPGGKSRWVELGGCGMVHPNVLKAVGIDPEIFSGWAFGFGIERIAMRKYGISNIRLFVENDVRFLRQF